MKEEHEEMLPQRNAGVRAFLMMLRIAELVSRSCQGIGGPAVRCTRLNPWWSASDGFNPVLLSIPIARRLGPNTSGAPQRDYSRVMAIRAASEIKLAVPEKYFRDKISETLNEVQKDNRRILLELHQGAGFTGSGGIPPTLEKGVPETRCMAPIALFDAIEARTHVDSLDETDAHDAPPVGR